MKNYKLKKIVVMTPICIVLFFVAFLILLPIFWILISAFKPEEQMIQYPPTLLPESFTVYNFIKVQMRINIVRYMLNSIIYAIGSVIPSIFFNSLAGYAFARYKFPGRSIIFMMYLSTLMIPFQVIMIPLFLVVHSIGFNNSYLGLIIPRIASAYWIFFLRAAFAGLPKELEEAARLDGLTEFGIYLRIMLPQIIPTVVTMLMLSINGSWNDLLWPLLITSSARMRTIANGLALFVGSETSEYGNAFAGCFLSLIPMLILFVFGQKYFVKGQITSGLKG
jgi:multiple sugar transport system permease protein